MADLKKLRAALDLICEQGSALRQGGPAPEDLEELSDSLHTAVNTAAEAIGELQERSLPRWLHVKRGTTYTEIGRGKMQAEHWRDPDINADYDSQRVDMREVVVYRADADGSIWVRPVEEFEDGRFVAVTPDKG